jgi:uncharacterized membrane protein
MGMYVPDMQLYNSKPSSNLIYIYSKIYIRYIFSCNRLVVGGTLGAGGYGGGGGGGVLWR